MNIRRVMMSEKDQALSVYRSLIGSFGCTWSIEYPSMEDVEEDIQNKALYGVYDNEALIALAAANQDDDYDELNLKSGNLKRACSLSRIGVRADYQRKGIARLLISAMEKDLYAHGYDGIHLLVSKTNPHAIALYESMSFKRCCEAFLYERNWYYYQKRLE